MLVELLDRLDEFARVEQFGLVYHVRNDQRGDTFAVADDRVGSFGRQVVDEVHTFVNITQFVKQSHHLLLHFDPFCFVGDNTLYDVEMAGYDFGKLSFISYVSVRRHRGCLQQFVRDPS